MSKRNKKNRPNLPKSTLERARRQAGLEPETADVEEEVVEVEPESTATKGTQGTVAERAARRRKLNPAQLERSRKRGDLDNDAVRQLLANPTEYVSEEQLAEEYHHVLLDLRNMGMLAVVLMVLLVALAQFI